MGKKYDFAGWATRNNLKCSDGRTIRAGAFADQDGMTVPLVWNHDHNDPGNVIGHSVLFNKSEGVYSENYLNRTQAANDVRELLRHGDVAQLSIYANHLKQNAARDVLHGVIREVSVVLAGANPGAFIDSVVVHSFEGYDEEFDDGAVIYTGESLAENLILEHSDTDEAEGEEEEEKKAPEDEDEEESDEATEEDEEDEEDEDMKDKDKNLTHADEGEGETIQEVFDTLTDKQKDAVYAIVGMALEGEGDDGSDEEDEDVKHNIFDNEYNEEDVLTHSDMVDILNDAKRYGSLRESVLQHGITNITELFPNSQLVGGMQEVKRDDEWVSGVMSGVSHSPFSRVKSMYANLTADEARAKGYIKGHMKKEEFFSVVSREVSPTTVYKKQKIDRDDLLDIKDFDVVAYMKQEMRSMLNEELARAFLVGDGRTPGTEDKINEGNIIPIWKDSDVFSVKVTVPFDEGDTDAQKAKKVIRAAVKNRKEYKGSGNPVLYTTEDWLTEMLLLEDLNQRIIYDTVDKLATAMRVSRIVTVPVMEGLVRTYEVSGTTYNKDLIGIIVNLNDYRVGADRGGEATMFDDFDIDYNAQKYLIETRCSGALIKPYSALILEADHVSATPQAEGGEGGNS